MILVIAFVCILSVSYAFFTASAERKGALNIVSGNLYSLITSTDINDEKAVMVNAGRSRTIRVKLANPNGIEAKFNFYYSTTSEDINIGYTTDGDVCPDEKGIVLSKNEETGDSKTFVVTIKNKSDQPVTITFGSDVGLASQDLEFPTDKHLVLIEAGNVVQDLLNKANSCDNQNYNSSTEEEKHEMYCFNHEVTDKPDDIIDYRYIGNDPYNYVMFNEKTWRIIGVLDDLDKDGNQEQRLKLIRDEVIGSYPWDNKSNGMGSATGDYGSNDWSDASLMDLLNNGAYWMASNGPCYSEFYNTTVSCDFSSSAKTTGLNDTAKKMIENMKWYLGGNSNSYNNQNAEDFWMAERGSEVYNERPTTWYGNVALMYPSDWMYTYGKGVHDECYNTPANSSKCGSTNAQNSWMFTSNQHEWALTPFFTSASISFYVNSSGRLYDNNAHYTYGVRPVVYLKSDVLITGGDGSKESPYTITD